LGRQPFASKTICHLEFVTLGRGIVGPSGRQGERF